MTPLKSIVTRKVLLEIRPSQLTSRLRMNLEYAPDNHVNHMKRSVLNGLSIAASAVFVISSKAVAKTFEPIERGLCYFLSGKQYDFN